MDIVKLFTMKSKALKISRRKMSLVAAAKLLNTLYKPTTMHIWLLYIVIQLIVVI